MPNLEELLAKAQAKQGKKKEFSRGNRPDRIASGAREPGTLKEDAAAPKANSDLSKAEKAKNKSDTNPTQTRHSEQRIESPYPTQIQHTELKSEPSYPTQIQHSASAPPKQYPTQTRHESAHKPVGDREDNPSYEDISDTNPTHPIKFTDGTSVSKSDTNPTHIGSTGGNQLPKANKASSEIRHKSDTPDPDAKNISGTNPTQQNAQPQAVSDTIPTLVASRSTEISDTTPTHIRHEISDTTPTQRVDIQHKSGTNPTHKPTQLRHISDTQPDTKFEGSPFRTLVGQQLQVLELLCGFALARRERILPRCTYDHLAKQSGVAVGSIRTTVKRLRDDGLIAIRDSRPGRGGTIQIEVFENVVMDFARTQGPISDTNPAQLRHTTRHKSDTQPDTTVPSSSSSSSYITKETTTTNTDELTSEWLAIDFSSLKAIGFSQFHLKQLFNVQHLTPVIVQDSIDAFAFDLEHNEKAKTISGPPLNFFMGILRKGPYAPPSNYESPQARQLRLYNEAKTRERKAREAVEAEAKANAFEDWYTALTPAQRRSFLHPSAPETQGIALRATLKEVFDSDVWPERRSEILGPVDKGSN